MPRIYVISTQTRSIFIIVKKLIPNPHSSLASLIRLHRPHPAYHCQNHHPENTEILPYHRNQR